MSFVLRAILLVLLLAGLAAAASTYTTKYDNVDLDEILNNQRLFKKYFDCLTNKGRCTPDGKELKEVLPDALATDCAKCSEKQKEGTDKVLRHLIEKRPAEFDELERIYDPGQVYRKKYEKKYQQ